MEKKELVIDYKAGHIIKMIRLQLNCTQEELGRKVGLDQPTVCRIERRYQLPTESTVEKVAHLAGVSAYQVTGQEPINYAAIW